MSCHSDRAEDRCGQDSAASSAALCDGIKAYRNSFHRAPLNKMNASIVGDPLERRDVRGKGDATFVREGDPCLHVAAGAPFIDEEVADLVQPGELSREFGIVGLDRIPNGGELGFTHARESGENGEAERRKELLVELGPRMCHERTARCPAMTKATGGIAHTIAAGIQKPHS